MSSISIKFGGKLIEELSQKIPSTLFALNELIKNSYDAFSPEIIIQVIPSELKVIVIDKGTGMDNDDISSLFHISKSSKKYGEEVSLNGVNRVIQGSKGLGFLSAFKFGDTVEWNTCKNGIRSVFSVKKSELVALDDISGIEISVITSDGIEDGTIITVFTSKDEMDELLFDLSEEKISEKLVASILDDSFNIKLQIENKEKVFSTNKLKSFKLECEESQLFYVKYDSVKEDLEFFHKGQKIKSVPFAINRSDYSVSVELIVFYFQKGKNSKSVSKLYKRVHDNALYPLVYINKNLFNNIMIFDPDLLRKKSSGDTLAQMIGHVSLRSQSNGIEFNSDRTNFVDSSLTRNLIERLRSLNELIQTTGGELKKELKNGNDLIPTGKAIPTNKSDELKEKTASIYIDRQKPIKFYIPSEQIDLEEYIFQVKNSNGDFVAKSSVDINVEHSSLPSRVLFSIEEPCEIRVSYRYNDKVTGLVSTDVNFSFEKLVSNISAKVQDKSLFTIQSGSGYNVKVETVSDLIYAIDKAYSTRSKEEYLPLIACSIRAIFEISADKLLKAQKPLFPKLNQQLYTVETKREIKDSLLKDVVHIIALVNKNNCLKTKISDVVGMSYSTFSNLLNSSEFKVAVKNSHIGAHQSTRFLSKPKIETCADACGFFAVICDVLIKIDKSELAGFNISKVDEADLNSYFS